MPAAPAGLSQKYLQLWDAYWSSELARVWDADIDTQAMARLFALYEDRDQLEVLYAKLKDVGIRKLTGKIAVQILALEDRFGLSPGARTPLGIKNGGPL
jgi:hypothetical protein